MPEKHQVGERWMRQNPQLFQKMILLATIKSYQFYRRMRGRLCPYEEARKSRRPDFYPVELNRTFRIIADYWDAVESQLDASQEYGLRYADVEELLANEVRSGRMTLPEAQALDGTMEQDMELFEFAPAMLSKLHQNNLLNAWLKGRAATNLIEWAYSQRVVSPMSLDDLGREIELIRHTQATEVWIDGMTYFATPLPKPKEIIGGLLRQGCRMCLSGGSKSFKSWMLLDLAVSVAHGDPWLGFPTAGGPVLFLNLELPDWALSDRIHAIARAKRGPAQPGRLFVRNLRGAPGNFEAEVSSIIAKAKEIGAVLIVVDPVYKLKRAMDENSTGDAAEILAVIERLSAQSGAAVVYGQHFSKGNQAFKESIDRISGSGVFGRDPDAILTFTAHREAFAYTCEATLRTEPPLSGFVVQWKYPLMQRNAGLKPEDLKRVGGRSCKHKPEALLEYLPVGGAKPGDWERAACARLTISETTFKDMRKRLNDAGQVVKEAGSGLWKPASAESPGDVLVAG